MISTQIDCISGIEEAPLKIEMITVFNFFIFRARDMLFLADLYIKPFIWISHSFQIAIRI